MISNTTISKSIIADILYDALSWAECEELFQGKSTISLKDLKKELQGIKGDEDGREYYEYALAIICQYH